MQSKVIAIQLISSSKAVRAGHANTMQSSNVKDMHSIAWNGSIFAIYKNVWQSDQKFKIYSNKCHDHVKSKEEEMEEIFLYSSIVPSWNLTHSRFSINMYWFHFL